MIPGTIVNVEVIVEREGRYLFIERSADEEYGAGWLTFPGGKLEPHGTGQMALEITAQRELMEEVRMDVALADLRYVESHMFFVGDIPVLDVVLMTRNAVGEARAVDPAEVAGIAWLTAAEAAMHPDIPAWTRASLAMAIT